MIRDGVRVGASPTGRPRALEVAVVVAALEATALLVFGTAVLVQALRGDRSSALDAGLLVGLLVVWAAGLGWAARGLWHARRWARAPVVLSELLLLAVGIPLVQGEGARWAGVLLVAASVAGLVAVLSPAVTASLE